MVLREENQSRSRILDMINKGNHIKFVRFVLFTVSEEAET